ncbi:MAG: hypothetical protein HYT87_17045 [Nitrospirae bacterium]|nr:hypothetical protein [Nitrospirota bacterium]
MIRRFTHYSSLITAAAFAAACGRSGGEDSFRIPFTPGSVIDNTSDAGIAPSLKFDSKKNAHISYYDAGCKALKYIEGVQVEPGRFNWQPQVKTAEPNYKDCGKLENDLTIIRGQIVDMGPRSGKGVGYWNWLVLDREDRPHIVYYDGDTRQLKYAWAIGQAGDGSWVFKKVFLDSEGAIVGRWLTAAMDDATPQNIHVAYTDGQFKKVKYLRWNRSWDEESQKDRPRIETIDLVDLGNFPGTEPVGKPLATAEGSRTAIALSKQDVFVVYYSSSDGDLRLARRNISAPSGSPFAVQILDDLPPSKVPGSTDKTVGGDTHQDNVGTWTAAEIDSKGILHIAYADETNKDLKQILYNPSTSLWYPRYRRVKNFDVGKNQLQVELPPKEDGTPDIRVVSELPMSDVSGTGTTVLEEWAGEIVDNGSGAGTGVGAAMTLDPFNRAILSYRDGTTGDLKIAFQDSLTPSPTGHAWATVPLDNVKTVGIWSSLRTIPGKTPEDFKVGIAYQGYEILETGSRKHTLLFRYFEKLGT